MPILDVASILEEQRRQADLLEKQTTLLYQVAQALGVPSQKPQLSEVFMDESSQTNHHAAQGLGVPSLKTLPCESFIDEYSQTNLHAAQALGVPSLKTLPCEVSIDGYSQTQDQAGHDGPPKAFCCVGVASKASLQPTQRLIPRKRHKR